MKKIGLLLLVLLVVQAAEAAEDIGKSLKKAGDAAGSGMGQAGKAVAPEVQKIESWLGSSAKKAVKEDKKAGK